MICKCETAAQVEKKRKKKAKQKERYSENETELSSLCGIRECLVCKTVITLPTIICTSSLPDRQARWQAERVFARVHKCIHVYLILVETTVSNY